MKMETTESFYKEMIDIFSNMSITPITATIKLLISFILGELIGFERQLRRQSAGMRTITLICMASTSAMMLSIWIPQSYPNFLNGDPGRIAAQILTGIGFLGAGAIMQSKGNIHGLTTAASIWTVSIIGMCVGASLYLPSIVLTALTLFVLIALEKLEKNRSMTGDNKLLTILFEEGSIDIELIKGILSKHSIFIYSISINRNYKLKTTQLELKIQVKPREIYQELFEEIHDLKNVSLINLSVL